VKVLVDQNLSTVVVRELGLRGTDAQHTSDAALEMASDEEIFEWCRSNGAVLLTADKRLTKYLAGQRAADPSVIVVRGYQLDFPRLVADLSADLPAITQAIADRGHAVFSMAPDRPTRAQLLPLISEVT
jgi:predicted nuclease of predicted toxin-antitoxin system